MNKEQLYKMYARRNTIRSMIDHPLSLYDACLTVWVNLNTVNRYTYLMLLIIN